ncbi:flagellar biosynthesis anti-sigma factor FlgM [Desulfurobacterium sp.]|uniref:flagellar biosynthesis anti-sigma factor FlgM n=1 Tax=Desulfurobacterium sp. TaxID=2004706 RepID=UPI00261A10C9|nr:flagellar biosynthesis anti-sigma factor FlgM [Desulfurobacterium sp.]
MKIEGFQNIAGVEAQHLKKQIRKRTRNGQADETVLQEPNAVSVNESTEIEKAVKEQVQLQSVDTIRVQEIKEAINSGNYPVDIHKISESILKEFLGL